MSYENAYQKTMVNEGLGEWSNDPDDPGGETYTGITRKNFPDLKLWKLIDAEKLKNPPGSKAFKDAIKYNAAMLKEVKQFYMDEFWIKPQLASVDGYYPELAEKMFNVGVNVGSITAGQWLQRSLNLLNRNQKSYPDLKKIDGVIGKKTLEAIDACLDTSPKERLLKTFKLYQGEHYINWMEANTSREKFIGLIDRTFE